MSPMELSSSVVAMTVLFLMLSLGEEVGDDSVPLGVYSVPGLGRQHWIPPWLQGEMKALLRHLAVASRSDARRLAMLLLVNLAVMVAVALAGLYHWNNLLLTQALRLLFTCCVLAVGLIGTILKYSRAGDQYSYGYGRFEPLCGCTNALLVAFTTLCRGYDDVSLLFTAAAAPNAQLAAGRHGAGSLATVGQTAGGLPGWFAAGAVGLQGVCAILVSVLCSADAALKRGKAPRAPGVEDVRSARARKFERMGAASSSSLARRCLELLELPSAVLNLSDISRNHNLQAVYVHLVGELLAAIVLALACVAGGGGSVVAVGDGVCGTLLKLVSVLAGLVVMTCIVPILWDAARVLLQATPVELMPSLPHLHKRIAAIPTVSTCTALHIWRLDSHALVASVKLTAGPRIADSNQSAVSDVAALLRQYGVTNACVEVVRDNHSHASPDKAGVPLASSGAEPAHGELAGGGSAGKRSNGVAEAHADRGAAARKLSMDGFGGEAGSQCRGDDGRVTQRGGGDGVSGRAEKVLRQILEDESRGLLGLGLGSGASGEVMGGAGTVPLLPPADAARKLAQVDDAIGAHYALLQREVSDPEPPYHDPNLALVAAHEGAPGMNGCEASPLRGGQAGGRDGMSAGMGHARVEHAMPSYTSEGNFTEIKLL